MKNLEQQVSTVSETASRMTYTGSGIGAAFGLAGIDWVAWIGVATAFAGLIINLFFKIREDRRSHELHKLKVQKIKENCHEQD